MTPTISTADFELPVVRERLVLLVSGDELKVEAARRDVSIRIASVGRAFPVHRMFLQDRIASQGIDTADFSASEQRIREVTERLRSNPAKTKLLIEMLLLAGDADFVIGYVTLFDAEAQFPRYFPVRSIADTIEPPHGEAPVSAALWERALLEETARAKRRLQPRGEQR